MKIREKKSLSAKNIHILLLNILYGKANKLPSNIYQMFIMPVTVFISPVDLGFKN